MPPLRIVVFGPSERVGVWAADRVVDLNAADRHLPADLLGLIEAGVEGLDAARAATDWALSTSPEGAVHRIADVVLRPPAVRRPRIGCAAGNYALHTLGSAKRKGLAESNALAGLVSGDTLPTPEEVVARTRERGEPRGFWKDFSTPHGPGDDISYPDRGRCLDYEGEVVAVVGRVAKDVPAGGGGDHVWGVTLHNDLSIRQDAPSKVRPSTLSFNLAKNWDGSASVGPSIVVGLDPADIEVETRVNGELRQKYHSGDMIFSHADFIEFLSRDLTLLSGDMISGGSGPGTATDADKDLSSGADITDEQRAALYLQVGDVVEVSSPAIGTLRNRIVAKSRG
jgi:2-keto-4-pentenoate hydratase/2-oxohepta-3-ene-1,7-dioic acid hydratase in catechol pathway